jgi:hypothetical protein
MKERDNARGSEAYRQLKNTATRMVRQDKKLSNMARLEGSPNDSKTLWELANQALGKQRPSLPSLLTLPDGSKTTGNVSAAKTMMGYYIDKVLNLRVGILDAPPAPTLAWPATKRPFSFRFATAGKVAKTIRNLKNTEALGID